ASARLWTRASTRLHAATSVVMPGLVPGIHVFSSLGCPEPRRVPNQLLSVPAHVSRLVDSRSSWFNGAAHLCEAGDEASQLPAACWWNGGRRSAFHTASLFAATSRPPTRGRHHCCLRTPSVCRRVLERLAGPRLRGRPQHHSRVSLHAG